MKLEDIRFEQPVKGYAPREDSWLLAQAIQQNKKYVAGKHCLDMGCGSGIQTATLILYGAKTVTCVDINESALKISKKMIETNFTNAKVTFTQSNLFEKIKKSKTFDVIVFNPPYVPSEKIKWVEVDGGKKGREVIDVFLAQLTSRLTKNGVCFLLQSSLNGNKTTQNKCNQLGLQAKIILKEKIFMEMLVVFEIRTN